MSSEALFGIFPGLAPVHYLVRETEVRPPRKRNRDDRERAARAARYQHEAAMAAARVKRHAELGKQASLVGETIDLLTVLDDAGSRTGGGLRCRCACGTVVCKTRWQVLSVKRAMCSRSCAARLQLQPCNALDSSAAIPRQASEGT